MFSNDFPCVESKYLEKIFVLFLKTCLKELFVKHQMNPLDSLLEAYKQTLKLAHYSTHEIQLIKNCYIEFALIFID